eukprot:SAG31_NODE_25244_length_465_cov_0.816940_1_plen_93_part_01
MLCLLCILGSVLHNTCGIDCRLFVTILTRRWFCCSECHCDQAYFPILNLTVSSVVGRVRATAPQVGLLSFSSMAGVIMERDCTASNNGTLADI